MLRPVTKNSEDWNRFVLENGGGFLQSWEWGRFQEEYGQQVFRYRLDAGEDGQRRDAGTVAQFTLVERSLPFGQRYAYIPMGPVVWSNGDYAAGFEACVLALRQAMDRRSLLFSRVEPFLPREGGPLGADMLKRLGFVPSREVIPAESSVLDLAPDESGLLAAMKQKTRYNIRLAGRKGVRVREADYSNAHEFRTDVESFLKLLRETTERDGFSAHPEPYYERMLDVLSPRKRGGMTVRLMLAEVKGDPAAGVLLAEFGDTVTYLHGASAHQFRSLMAPYLLHWEAIRRAKSAGFARYDFWGIAPEDAGPEHPWQGITRFKVGFGGRRVSYVGTWDLPRSQAAYRSYRAARSLNKALRSVLKGRKSGA